MGDIYMHICPKCGWFKGRRVCDFCKEQMIPTEVLLTEAMKMTDRQKKEVIDTYIGTMIKDTYDPKAREYREANEKPLVFEVLNIPKCPTCGSTNVEKISLGRKAIGGALFGLFSSDIRNSMYCRNCGAKW